MTELRDNWWLATDPDNTGKQNCWHETGPTPGAQPAPVPGVIQQVFPAYHGVAWYWHRFRVHAAASGPGSGEGRRALLHFGAVDYLAEVWVNGRYAGLCEGGETPFEFDITGSMALDGDNLLAVRVLNPSTERIDGYLLGETPHRNKTMPPRCGSAFNSGGIMYPVELRFLPPVYITDLFARPDVDTGEIAVSVSVRNAGATSSRGQIALSVSPATKGDILQTTARPADYPTGESIHELTVTLAQPRPWDLEDPFLYRVTAIVTTETTNPHQQSVRCGFRDFRVVDGYFQLNGQRIFLKSTHTGNCMPIGQQVAVLPDHVRRDLIFAKASGFNTVRFISGVAYPEQLDFCDEIGLMVYEECFAGWCLQDSPAMAERFDRNTSAIVRRDRNHPSVTIWGLLNETGDGPVFRQAVSFLPKLRQLDPTRLVLLGSGRWDAQWAIGSASNPHSDEWEHVWGVEGPQAPPVDGQHARGYMDLAGDAHTYPHTPTTPETVQAFREFGASGKPVFLSEYGIGSVMDVIREWRHFEQVGARPDLEDAAMLRAQSEAFYADWARLAFDDVYPFPEDLLRESQRLHARQRTLGFDLIRANPKLCGFNLTGMLDHAITGEGLWTYWREWKPGTFDAVSDGWSPLRWCLLADPLHGYSGRMVTVEAALASEDVLRPGEYPARFRIFGPDGVAWERAVDVKVPDPAPLAVPVLRETVALAGAPGQYIFAANLARGGAPTGGRLTFHLSDPASLPRLGGGATLWGIDDSAREWLAARGLDCRQFDPLQAGTQAGAAAPRELILVGQHADAGDPTMWKALTQRISRGATAVFLSAKLFQGSKDALDWLPSQGKARCYAFDDSLYHKECVAKRHPVFEGLQGPGIMDWDYYGPVIPHDVFEGLDTPDETIAAAFTTGHPAFPTGYGSGLLIARYRSGEGGFILSTPYVLENLDVHPAADRLLVNLVRYGQSAG